MYRSSATTAIETGVLRTWPDRRPRTDSRCCEPMRRPRRSNAMFILTIQAGGGVAAIRCSGATSPFGAALPDVHALDDAERQRDADQRRAAMADERQRDAGDRHDPEHHADVHEQLEQEHRRDP